MENNRYSAKGYALALVLGTLGGALIVVLGTKAVPRMMSNVMTAMMQNMKGQMMKVGINPVET
jgi:hypothetical protein